MLVSIASASMEAKGAADLISGSSSVPNSGSRALQPVSGADLARAAIGSEHARRCPP